MPARVLVTGGAGFIGSRLIRALASEGTRIWGIDNLLAQVHGPTPRFPELEGHVAWVKADVTDVSAVRHVVADARPHLVFHLAAETGTGQSLDEVARYCETNVMGTAHLIEALRLAQVPAPKLVLASSRAVYGEGAYLDDEGGLLVPPPRKLEDMVAGRFDPALPCGEVRPIATPEASPPRPASVYASTKLMQEYILRQCAEAAGWPLVILRLQNVYGPGQSLTNPYTGVLSVFIDRLLNGRRIEIYEDGAITRDFVFVDDVVHALVLAGRATFVDLDPINIGTGQGKTIQEVAQHLIAHVGIDPSYASVSGKFRMGDVRHAVADITRARNLLRWTPAIEIVDGTRALVEWAQAAKGCVSS